MQLSQTRIMRALISGLLLQTLQFHSLSFQGKPVNIPEQGAQAQLSTTKCKQMGLADNTLSATLETDASS